MFKGDHAWEGVNWLGWHLAYRMLGVKKVRAGVLHQDTINSVKRRGANYWRVLQILPIIQ